MRTRRPLAVLFSTIAVLAAGLVVPVAASAQPVVGACFDYPMKTPAPISSAAPAISCDAPHTAETYFVRTLPDAFGTPSASTVSARTVASRPCTTQAMNAYLGMSARVIPSRFLTVVVFPTDAQWNAGERWMRCDTALQLGIDFTPITGTAAAFVAATPAESLNACTRGNPSPVKNALYPCTPPKRKDWAINPPRDLNWLKVLEQPLTNKSKFPGDNAAITAAIKICQKQGKAYKGVQKYPGWWRINPTSSGWKKGRRTIQCFVPYAQYLEHLAKLAPTPAPTPSPTATAVPAAPSAPAAPSPSPSPSA